MRFLLTVASLDRNFGGPVGKVNALAVAMRNLGHSVDIIGTGEKKGKGVIAIKQALRFHSTPIPLDLGLLKKAVTASDVVHIVGFRDPVGTLAAHFASRARIPYVFEPAGMHRRRIRSHKIKGVFDATIGRRIVEQARVVIATSRLERKELIEDGLEESRVVIRPNGLELEDYPREASQIRPRLGIPQNVPLVVHLGRISKKKGLIPLIRAVRSMEQVWLLIAGPDDGDGTLQAIRAEAAYADDRIKIEPDGLWGEDKWDAYAEADVFCLHSETENFGNAAAEAAASGLPVAITDACGIAEWLNPESSRVIQFGDQAGLVESLRQLLKPSAKKAAERAAPALRETLDWNSIAKRQIEIYRTALSLDASA